MFNISHKNCSWSYKPPDLLWSNIKCLNCDKKDHIFKTCKYPINSYGIIAYTKINDILKVVLIQRKDTIGYIDFIRGKYSQDNTENSIKLLIEEMTEHEREKILNYPFRTIWDNMWFNKKSITYLNEFKTAEKKFKKFDKYNIIIGSCSSKFDDTEFGFPKGRKMKNETKIECALREFREETGLTNKDIKIDLENPTKFIEVFYGSNTLVYRHTYYLAELITDKILSIDPSNVFQLEEIKQVCLKTFKESVQLFSSSPSKRNIMYQVKKHLGIT